MTAPAANPRTEMVGRSAELQILRDAFSAGRSGSPRVVVVRGEAGIGKTRLLQEFRDEISRVSGTPDVVVAVGQCVEVGTIGAPFTPVRRLLREVWAGVGDTAFREAARSDLVLATLGNLVPEVADGTTAAIASRGDYVTEAVERIIENLSVDHHLVLVIEDLHWADTATLDLLKTLAVTLRGSHVTVIMTYRSDDVGRSHPLRPVLAELDRSRAVTGIALDRLTPEEIVALVRSIAGADDSIDLAQVAARSEGVPFFIEELVDLGGDDLPDTLRSIVLARYERLSDAAKDVVGMLSAGGVHVEHTTLAAIHGGDTVDLDAGVREALSVNVIVAEGEGYSFRHALIREVVHDDLLPSERSGLHRRYAAVLQDRVDRGDRGAAMAAAEHWLAAREVERAFEATIVARDHAVQSSAVATAALLGERLLDLRPQIPSADDRLGVPPTSLAAQIAEQWLDAGDMDRTIRVARAGIADSDGSDPVGVARLHRVAAGALGNSGRLAESSAECRAAISVLTDERTPAAAAVRARAMALRAVNDSGDGDSDARVETILDEAIAQADASADADALAYCTLMRAWVAIDRGDSPHALDLIGEVIASPTVPTETRLNARNSQIDVLVRLGRRDDAITAGLEGMKLATAAGLERSLGSYMATNVAEAMISAGRGREAVPLLRRALELLTRTPAFASFGSRLLATHFAWNDDAGSAAAARPSQKAAMVEEDPEERVGWAETDAEGALLVAQSESDPSRRRVLVGRAVGQTAILADPNVLDWPGRHRRLLPSASWAATEAALLGMRSGELERLEGALATASTTVSDDAGGAPIAAMVRAERARADADPERTVAAWRDAVDACETGDAPVRYLHYSRFRLGEALIAAGDREGATPVLGRVVREAPEQGATAVARWARDLAARAGVVIESTDAAPARRAEASVVPSLTPRELQVLALVAEGLTNPQIGERLFISPKTASVHVSAILSKVGAANRAEAAALYAAQTP